MAVHLAGNCPATKSTCHGVLRLVEVVVVIVRVFGLVVISLQVLTPHFDRFSLFRWFFDYVVFFHLSTIRRYVFKLL